MRERVLLIAPHSDLRFARSERSNWAAAVHLDVVEVPSPVTVVAVTRAFAAGQYDGVVIIGHGQPAGIPLDDGELLDYDTLCPFIRGRVRWLYLGVCDSEELAMQLHREWAIPIVYTTGKVYDKIAYSRGTALLFGLENGQSFEAAAQHAVGESRAWKFVNTPMTPEQAAYIAAQQMDGGMFRRYHIAAPV